MRFGRADALQDLRVRQPCRVVTQVRVGVDARPHLAESLALDDDDLGLRYIAGGELFQQLPCRHARADFIGASLDAPVTAGQPAEQCKLPGRDADACRGHRLGGPFQAETGADVEIHDILLIDFERDGRRCEPQHPARKAGREQEGQDQ